MALPDNITAARESAQSLSGSAGQMASESFKVGDILKQKALDAYKNNQDIIKPLDEATTEYVQAPSEARARYVDPQSENYVFNPFQAENLVSQYVSQQAIPMLMLSSILGQRFGRIDDTIGAGTRAYQAAAAAEQARAQQAQNLYTNLLNEYQITQQLESQRLADELAREKWEYDKATSGGGGGAGLGVGTGLGVGSSELVPTGPWQELKGDMLGAPMSQNVPLSQSQGPSGSDLLRGGIQSIGNLLGRVEWPWESGRATWF